MRMKRIVPTLAALAVIAPSAAAFASSSGAIEGKLYFYQNQGNYCPVGRDCTGAKYREAEYHTNQPIANVKVYADPPKDSKVLSTLSKTDELIASGDQKNGFVQVDSSNFSGWVQRSLVGPGH